jgi:hypothetical protein
MRRGRVVRFAASKARSVCASRCAISDFTPLPDHTYTPSAQRAARAVAFGPITPA